MAAARRNTQDITAASQIRGSFSRDNSPQKKQGKLVERCTAHARERDKHQIEKTSLLTRDFGPHSVGLLICTLISENQGLSQLSNHRKISGPAHQDFFSVYHLDFFSGFWYKSSFFLGGYL